MTIGFFIKLLRYSGAFRERAWLGRAHRQLPTHNTEKSCFGAVSLLFSLTSVAGVCFDLNNSDIILRVLWFFSPFCFFEIRYLSTSKVVLKTYTPI